MSCKSTILLLLSLTAAFSAQLPRQGREPLHGAKQGQSGQNLTLYDGTYLSGSSVTLKDYVPDMGATISNRASSALYNGVWLLYDYTNYDSSNGMFYFWGDDYRIDDYGLYNFNDKASSGKYSGDPINYRIDSINMYQTDGFGGVEQYYYTTTPLFAYDNMAASIITTGYGDWTIYENSDFTGRSFCLPAAPDGRPIFYFTANLTSWVPQGASSARVSLNSCFGKSEVAQSGIKLREGEFGYYPGHNV